MNKNKVIFHIDADSFFVSSELSLRPELKNKDIAIGKNKSNSIVSSLSYSAKEKGAKVPMKLYEVKKYAPSIIVLETNMFLYETISKKIYNFLRLNYSRNIEIGSIDEWYLDVSNLNKKYKSPIELAEKIQNDILNKFDISVSIGISYNKFLAKMATDFKKPFGISIIKKSEIQNKIWPLKISSFIGIGKTLSSKLIEKKILTIGDLAKINKNDLIFKNIFKNTIDYFIKNANGEWVDEIDQNKNNSLSIGAQFTMDYNQSFDLNYIYQILKKLSKRISNELIEKNLHTSNIMIYIKYLNHKSITSSKRINIPINDEQNIYKFSLEIFNKIWNEKNILTIGITAQNLKNSYYLNSNKSLFEENFSIEKLNKNHSKIINIINETNEKIKSNNLKLLSNKV